MISFHRVRWPAGIAGIGWSCLALLLCLCAPAQEIGVNETLLLPVKQGGKWGYADTARNMIIAPQFDAANPFQGPVAVVEMKKKAYAIDRSGKILTPGFDQLIQVEDTILSIYLNEVSDSLGGWGLSTLSGNLLLKPAYDEVTRLDNQVYAFRKDTLWGAVSRSGNIIVEAEYDSLWLYPSNALMLAKNKKYGLIGIDGKRYLDDRYLRIYWLSASLYAAKSEVPKGAPGNGWGAYDRSSQLVIPHDFDTLRMINSYFAGAGRDDSFACYFSRAPGNPTPVAYKEFSPLNSSWVRLYDFKKNCALADSMGTIIIPGIYSDILSAGNQNWFVADKNKRWGMRSSTGELLVEPKYRVIQPFRGNVTIVIDSAGQGLINHRGEVLVSAGNQQIIIRGNAVKVLRPDNSATILTIGNDGSIIDRVTYDEFRVIKVGGRENVPGIDFNNNRPARAMRTDTLRWFYDNEKNLWGMVNQFTGDTVLRPKFSNITRAGRSLTRVEIPDTVAGPYVDGKETWARQRCGLINDTTAQFILKPVYVTIMIEDLTRNGFENRVRATLPNGTMALVSLDGKETRFVYTWIETLQQGYARFCTGGKWTIEDGGEIISPVRKFCTDQRLDARMSFGGASISQDFMMSNVKLAGGKWGYLDSTGKVIVAATYDGAKTPFASTGIVRQGKKWGLVDMSGMVKMPCSYDGLSYLRMGSGATVLAQNNNVRYGYIDATGNIVVPADLKKTTSLGGGYIGFTRTGRWGVMNVKGETICAENYHEILPFSEGYAAVRKGNRWGYIDTLGTEVVPLIYEKAGPFSCGMARVLTKQRWGYIDKSGILVIEAKYLQAGEFLGISAPVKNRDGFGLISKEGKWLLKPTWRRITPLEGSNLYVVRNDYAQGLCRNDGKLLVSPRYEGYTYLGEGRISYRVGLYCGLMDTTGKVMSGPVYERIRSFSQGLAATSQNGQWGYIRPNGKFAIPPQYRLAGQFGSNLAFVTRLSVANRRVRHGSYFIDTTGEFAFAVDTKWSSAMPFHEGKSRILYKKDEKSIKYFHYYVTQHGVRVNRFEYDDAGEFEGGVARVCIDNRWGLVSFTGYYVVKPRFTHLEPFDNGLARFQLKTIYGLYTLEGTEILPVQYDYIGYDQGPQLVRYERANAMGYLFRDGRVCWAESE